MTHRLTAFFFVLAVVSLSACSHRADDQASSPPFVEDHGVLRVPDGSPLRKALIMAPVEMRSAPHALVFPATVESDPARTANVVVPLTGRITELKVGLGDHVVRNQLLAVIESGDMAQAYADVAKAADVLHHALAFPVVLGTILEDQRDQREAERAAGTHGHQAGRAGERTLERRGDLLLDLLCGQARHLRRHLRGDVAEFRIRLDGQLRPRVIAKAQHQHRHHDEDHALLEAEVEDRVNH